MDKTILTLHPLTDAAAKVLKDPRNRAMSQGTTSALSLTFNQAPKSGSDYVIGRSLEADIVLDNPTISARHCIISVNKKGVPYLFEQSTNGTLINGKRHNRESIEIQDRMHIDICDAVFEIRVPWRGVLCQRDYIYNAKRAKEIRGTPPPVASSSFAPAPICMTLVEKLGPYTLTNTCIDSFKVETREISRTLIVRKGCSFFAAKKFLGQRALPVWEEIKKIQHPNIIHLEEILRNQSDTAVVMEFLPIGNVGEIFCDKGKTVANDTAVNIMRQLLDAVASIHKLGIVHMRIDIGNLLVSSERPVHIKLTGFDDSISGRKIESPAFIPSRPPEFWERQYRASVSPEIWEAILKNQGYVDKRLKPLYSSSIDIWSAGLVCSQLTLGKTPCYVDGNELTDKNAVDYVEFLLAEITESGVRIKTQS